MIFILNLIRHATFHGHNSMYVRRPDPFPFREGCGYARLGAVMTANLVILTKALFSSESSINPSTTTLTAEFACAGLTLREKTE